MTHSPHLSAPERQGRLSQLVEQHRRVTVAEVCEVFGVSEATARRDLDALATGGRIQRVHGGAILAQSAPPEGPALERALDQVEEKRRIGEAAARLIDVGDSLFIGSGTTSLELARNVPKGRELTVVTNSLLVLLALAERTDIALVCLGGVLRHSEGSMIGHLTEQALKELRLHKVFISARGVDIEAGLTNDFLGEAVIDRQIMNAGRQIMLLADHTKCGRVSTGFLAPLSRVHTLVTDLATPQDFLEKARHLGVRVVSA